MADKHDVAIERLKAASEMSLSYLINDQPTVDAVPVVHGKWVTDENGITFCGRCRVIDDYASVHNYCPNCGAKMDLEVKDV